MTPFRSFIMPFKSLAGFEKDQQVDMIIGNLPPLQSIGPSIGRSSISKNPGAIMPLWRRKRQVGSSYSDSNDGYSESDDDDGDQNSSDGLINNDHRTNGANNNYNDGDNDDNHKRKEEPFWVTFVKVGACLFVLVSVAMSAILYQTRVVGPQRQKRIKAEHRMKKLRNETYAKQIVLQNEEGLDSLPYLELEEDRLSNDVFGVAQKYFSADSTSSNSTKTALAESSFPLFLRTAQTLQRDFADRYGGIRSARYLLQKSLYVEEDSGWTERLQRTRNTTIDNGQTGTFHVLVLGEGSVAGYGNYKQQAFSNVLEWTMTKAFSELGMELRVTNAALEHVAMFPHLWCLHEFVNPDDHDDNDNDNEKKQNQNMDSNGTNERVGVDMVYADFGILSAADFEMLVRSLITLRRSGQGGKAPLMVFWDSRQNEERLEVVRHYVEMGLLDNALFLHWKEAVKPYLKVKPSKRPQSFREWNKYGNTRNKDIALWTGAQHELTAGLLSMFLLRHLQLVVANELGLYSIPHKDVSASAEHVETTNSLPYPIIAKASQL